MKRAVVTGATSMLGIATIKECLNQGCRVLAIARPGSKRKSCLPDSENLKLFECDLSRLSSLYSLEESCDVFYHFGWGHTDQLNRDNSKLQAENIGYTIDALELAHRLGCKKFIGAGSQAEYGVCEGLITEETPAHPITGYGIAKYAAGLYAAKICKEYEMVSIWTRTFSVYGINDGINTMISYALRQYYEKKPARFSSGTQMWDYLFEEDAGKYFYLIGDKMEDSGIIHVANGEYRQLKSFLLEMAEVLGDSFSYELSGESGGNIFGICPDVTKLRKITGYVPQVSFSNGIEIIRDNLLNK